MWKKVKLPVVQAVLFTLLALLILTYQNCAKPLDELGVNTTASSGGSCEVTPAVASLILGGTQSIDYVYSPSNQKIRIVILNNSTGVFTENVYSQSGSLDIVYNQSSQIGTYTVFGVVENSAGSSLGNCQNSFTVKTISTGGPLPPTPVPTTYTYTWVTGAWSACSATACGTTGTQFRTVSCKRNDGVIVANTYCTGTKPASTQACSAPACTTPPPDGGGGCKIGATAIYCP